MRSRSRRSPAACSGSDLGRAALAAFAGLVLLTGCGARSSLPEPRAEESGTGGSSSSSVSSSSTGTGGGCALDPAAPRVLTGKIRDFSTQHPDFEHFIGDDRGIVLPALGADGEPVYDEDHPHPTTTGKADFDQWYHDTPGVNLGEELDLTFGAPGDGSLDIVSDAFFPIDGQLLGDEGLPHNFSFTLEGHTSFRFQGGEVLDFLGDDDLWVFVDGRLALDLGGVHSSEGGEVKADDLGLEPGKIVPLDIYFAERHTSGSVFQLRLRGFNLCQ